ncbi:MAG: histidine kinase dimerization/phospho-acceptor domain-containing protein [Oscillospiraceae bacterium]
MRLPEFRQLQPARSTACSTAWTQAFDAQRQFTGNAAHELRTPLALMQAQLELLCAGASADVTRRNGGVSAALQQEQIGAPERA